MSDPAHPAIVSAPSGSGGALRKAGEAPSPAPPATGTLRRMNSNVPAQKVTAATAAAGLVTLVAWLYESQSGQHLPAAVVGALTAIATFAAGYLAPPGRGEQVIELNELAGPPSR